MRRMVTDAEIEKLGGIKLYKHVAYGDWNAQGDITSVKFEFITTRKESLNGVLIDSFTNFISGWISVQDQGEWGYPGAILSKEYIYFYNAVYQEISHLDTSYTPSEGKFILDTVTEL